MKIICIVEIAVFSLEKVCYRISCCIVMLALKLAIAAFIQTNEAYHSFTYMFRITLVEHHKLSDTINSDLRDWEEIKGIYANSSILLGNGFSQNIWKSFNYTSLFHLASQYTTAGQRYLDDYDIALFGKLSTENFEDVLNALTTSKSVLQALGQDTSVLGKREVSIRKALIYSVRGAHIIPACVPDSTLDHIWGELSQYLSVFTTNYDLLIYWSIMRSVDMSQKSIFLDYLWHGEFDIRNTAIWNAGTKVHFLHGGLHLCRYPDGSTKKRKSTNLTILEQLDPRNSNVIPLFVSEGTAKQKMFAISNSDYLTFMHQCLENCADPLVIFGHSLNAGDQHIVDAISRMDRPIAISICDDVDIKKAKAKIVATLLESDNSNIDIQNIQFFNSKTHPLGRANLQIPLNS